MLIFPAEQRSAPRSCTRILKTRIHPYMNRNSILALALGSCTLCVLPACKPGDTAGAAVQESTPAIKVFQLRHQDVTNYGEWFGYLRGEQDTDIHPRISGFLISQDYREGTTVKAGDILFRIDPKLYEAELERSKANLQAAQATLTSAQATADKAALDVKRYAQLVQSGSVSEKDLSDAQQTLKAAQAQVEATRAQIGQQEAAVSKAQINLDYTIIRAPYDGIIGTANVSIGDLVSPATKLTNITSIDPIRVDFSVNGDHLINIFSKYGNIGTNSNADSPPAPRFQLLMEDGTMLPHQGTLIAMDSVLTSSGLVNIEGIIPNPDNVLRGGMPVRVRIPLSTGKAMLVPKAAIRNVLLNNFIVVVDKENVPHMIPVTIGGEYQLKVEESNGYHSMQTMVSVKDYGSISLSDSLKHLGYNDPSDAQVVCDTENAVLAVNISSANSRLPKGEKPATIKTTDFTFKPAPNPALAAAAENTGKTEQAPPPEVKATLPPFPVKISNMLQQDVAETGTWFGKLRGIDEADIRPQVSGFLLQQHFKDGSMVKKGDLLFTIDPAPYQAALDEARANLVAARAAREQAQAQLTMSRQTLERYLKLRETTPGAVSDKVVTDSETMVATNEAAVRKADATIAQMQAAVHQAEINLDYTTIEAPFDGRIGIHKPSVGSLVSSSDPEPLVTLSSVNPIRVDFGMSGRGAMQGFNNHRIRKANPDKAAPQEFELVLDDNSLYPRKGHIVTANNTLSTSTGTLDVVGHIDNEDSILRSGMAVTVRAKMHTIPHACLVPARAPLNAKGMDLIIILKPDNTPQMLPITKGPIINLKLDNGAGKEYLQPMQVIEPNRSVVTGMMLAKTQAPNLEAIILGGAKVQNWGELLLKQAGVSSFRELLEKQDGHPLPDSAPAEAGVADWGELLLRRKAAPDFRALVLREAGAKDELDLIALQQGFNSLMAMCMKNMGFDNVTDVPVIVEGSIMAAQTYAANEAAKAPVNKLTPQPFIYIPTKTVTPSVTAEPVKEVSQFE